MKIKVCLILHLIIASYLSGNNLESLNNEDIDTEFIDDLITFTEDMLSGCNRSSTDKEINMYNDKHQDSDVNIYKTVGFSQDDIITADNCLVCANYLEEAAFESEVTLFEKWLDYNSNVKYTHASDTLDNQANTIYENDLSVINTLLNNTTRKVHKISDLHSNEHSTQLSNDCLQDKNCTCQLCFIDKAPLRNCDSGFPDTVTSNISNNKLDIVNDETSASTSNLLSSEKGVSLNIIAPQEASNITPCIMNSEASNTSLVTKKHIFYSPNMYALIPINESNVKIIEPKSIDNLICSIECVSELLLSKTDILHKSTRIFLPNVLNTLYKYLNNMDPLKHPISYTDNSSLFLKSIKILLKKFFVRNIKHLQSLRQYKNTKQYLYLIGCLSDHIFKFRYKNNHSYTISARDFILINQKVYRLSQKISKQAINIEVVECLILNIIISIKTDEKFLFLHSYVFIRNCFSGIELTRRLLRFLVFTNIFYNDSFENDDVKIPYFIKCVCYSKYYLTTLTGEIIDTECKILFEMTKHGKYKAAIGMWFPFYSIKDTAYYNWYRKKMNIEKDVVNILDKLFISNFEYIDEIICWGKIQ